MGMVHALFLNGSKSFYNPSIILPLFLDNLDASKTLIGAFSSVLGHHGGGFFGGIPQLFVANLLENKKYKKPMLALALITRALSWILLAAATYFWADNNPDLTMILLFVLLTIFTFMGGVGRVPLMDIWGKAIPPGLRGRFFGHRQFWGSLLAIGTGFAAKGILADTSLKFPDNFSLLFLLAGLALTVAGTSLMMVKEPVEKVHPRRRALGDFFKKSTRLIERDKNFGLYLVVQILAGSSALSLPFYVLFAKDNLGAGPALVGNLIIAQMTGSVISNLLWAHLTDRVGSRQVILLSTLTNLAIPLTFIFAPSSSPGLLIPLFLMAGFAMSGLSIGNTNFVLDASPAKERLSYVGISGTLKMPLMLYPLLGGIVAQNTSYHTLFIITAAALSAAVAVTFQLVEPRRGK